MRIRLVGVLLLSPAGLAAIPASSSTEPVAIVYGLSGIVVGGLPSALKPLSLFNRLPSGALVHVGASSQLYLALFNGKRFELGPNARATVSETDLVEDSGPVRRLAAVPALPHLASPTVGGNRSRYGAIRVRGAQITGLYPNGDAVALADRTVLRFTPVPGLERYEVELKDDNGQTILKLSSDSSTASVRPGMLRPGSHYLWTVRAGNQTGETVSASAAFVTLSRDLESSRTALEGALSQAGDAASLALLAEVDRSLGLLWESREELRLAVEKSPKDAALRASFENVQRQVPVDH
jgi:hypothetical protein